MNQAHIQFFSGLVSGLVSVTLCSPLEIVRTRLQVVAATSDPARYGRLFSTLRTIYREEGFRGYYQGYRVSIIAIPFFLSIYFPLYTALKQKCSQKKYSKAQTVLAGSFGAGLISNVISNPLWIARTRIMVQVMRPEYGNQHSLTRILKSIYKEEGVRGYFKGLTLSVVGLSHAVFYFSIYQKLKELYLPEGSPTFSIFAIATTSKIIASCITYPHVLLRSRIQDSRSVLRLGRLLSQIWGQEGVRGFYRGMSADMLRIVPSNAITFICYQKIKLFLAAPKSSE